MGDVLPLRPESRKPEPLWRELTGKVLRELRHERRERLSDTAGRAGISTQYLSEIERGRKDPSSEVLSAISGALGITLLDLTLGIARRLSNSSEPTRGDVGPLRGPLALAA